MGASISSEDGDRVNERGGRGDIVRNVPVARGNESTLIQRRRIHEGEPKVGASEQGESKYVAYHDQQDVHSTARRLFSSRHGHAHGRDEDSNLLVRAGPKNSDKNGGKRFVYFIDGLQNDDGASVASGVSSSSSSSSASSSDSL